MLSFLASAMKLLIISIQIFTLTTAKRNVCKTFFDYTNHIETNPNCWYDPDVDLEPQEIINRHGYPFENHTITTKDGYILSIFRIPQKSKKLSKTVILHHGFTGDALIWLQLGKKSPALVLSSHGYDVWMINCRGSKYSSRHEHLTEDDDAYWDFSFHEMAVIDLPAIIDYIRKYRNVEKVTYIGHSMGTAVSFIYCSLFSNDCKKTIERVIALAPIAFMGNLKTILLLIQPFQPMISSLLESLHIVGIGSNFKPLLDIFHEICAKPPFISMCFVLASLIEGVGSDEVLPENFPIFTTKFPGQFSTKTLVHLSQLVSVKTRFQNFDYGPDGNLQHYHSAQPMEYPLERISVPVHVFYGFYDLLSCEKDVLRLYAALKCEKTIMKMPYGHENFMNSKHCRSFFHILIDLIK